MIELLVAVVILVVIMLAFGMIITTVQGTVTTGQQSMRSNAAAASIIDTIRADIRQITQNGFICITQSEFSDQPVLLFTTAGITHSRTEPYRPPPFPRMISSGALVAVGMCINHASPDGEALYCQRWLLKRMVGDEDGDGQDDINQVMDDGVYDLFVYDPSGLQVTYDLASLQGLARPDINDNVVPYLCESRPSDDPALPSAIYVPPQPNTSDQLKPLWQVLADSCEWISLMWTDGLPNTTTGLLNWYGIDYVINDNGTPDDPSDDTADYHLNEGDSDWKDNSPADTTVIEFNGGSSGAPLYRALWTHHNQNNWPQALKIRIKLEGHERPYEVICPVGR